MPSTGDWLLCTPRSSNAPFLFRPPIRYLGHYRIAARGHVRTPSPDSGGGSVSSRWGAAINGLDIKALWPWITSSSWSHQGADRCLSVGVAGGVWARREKNTPCRSFPKVTLPTYTVDGRSKVPYDASKIFVRRRHSPFPFRDTRCEPPWRFTSTP